MNDRGLTETESQFCQIECVHPNEALLGEHLTVCALLHCSWMLILLLFLFWRPSPKTLDSWEIFLVSVTQVFVFPFFLDALLMSQPTVWCSASCGSATSSCISYTVKVMPPPLSGCQQKESASSAAHQSSSSFIRTALTFALGCWLVFFVVLFLPLRAPTPSVKKIIPRYRVPYMSLLCPLFRQLPLPSAASPTWPLAWVHRHKSYLLNTVSGTLNPKSLPFLALGSAGPIMSSSSSTGKLPKSGSAGVAEKWREGVEAGILSKWQQM